MELVSTPDRWNSAYQPIEYVFQNKVVVPIDDPADYLGLVASTSSPLFYKLKCFGLGAATMEVGDRINIQYNNTVSVGQLFNRNFTITGFDTDENPILDALVGSITLPPGTINYKGFAWVFHRKACSFELYAGFPAWHPKNAVRNIDTLVAEVILAADLEFNYRVRVEAFLQGLLSNPAPVLGNDDAMYIGFKLKSLEGVEYQAGGVYYCLNGTTADLNSSDFVTSNDQLTDSNPIIFAGYPLLISRIVDDYVINKTV